MQTRHWANLAAFLAVLMILAGCAGQMEMIKGEARLKDKQYNEAIPFFREALAANPDNCPARTRLGFALLKTGKLNEAEKELNQVLQRKPNDSLATLYMGITYASKGETGKAIELWRDFKSPTQPLVEAEIKRQLTLMQIVHGQRLAKQALAEEAKLGARAPDANTVAVCYFEDLTSNKSLGAFQKGLAAMVATDLTKVKAFKVVERTRLQALLAEMKLGQTGIVDAKSAPRVGRLLGADKLVVGSLAKGSIEVAMTLSSAGRANVLGSTQLSVPTEQFYTLPAAMIQSMARIVGVPLSPAETAAIGIPHTQNIKAFTLFGQALEALDAGKWQEAKDLFSQALAEDPKFDLAREGAEGAPSGDTPGISALSAMPASQLSNLAENALEAAQASQSAADAAAAADGASGGGGGGY